MPAKASWIVELPRILETLETFPAPVLDRTCIEQIFRVRRRRAIELMHRFGGYQAGQTLLVERSALLRSLRRFLDGDYRWEAGRRRRLAAELARARQLLPGQRVRLPVPPEVLAHRMADLPAGVSLQAGELRVRFRAAEDLLQQLFDLSRAILNDYEGFEALCGRQPPPQLPL